MHTMLMFVVAQCIKSRGARMALALLYALKPLRDRGSIFQRIVTGLLQRTRRCRIRKVAEAVQSRVYKVEQLRTQ